MARGRWSKEACTLCGNEGYASRSEPWQGEYVCGDCEMYNIGYADGVKELAAVKAERDAALADAQQLRRAYDLSADAVAERDQLLEKIDWLHKSYQSRIEDIKAYKDEQITAWQALFEEYCQHDYGCPAKTYVTINCDCGLAEDLSKARTLRGGEDKD